MSLRSTLVYPNKMFATNASKLDPATGLILIRQTGIKNVYTMDIYDINI